MTSKSILIIGSTGFIGSALSKYIRMLGHTVTSINLHHSTGHADGDASLAIDLLNPKACQSLCGHRFQYVFNCAGYVDHTGYFTGGKKAFDQHFTLVKNLVDHLNWDSIESFVQIGSSDEYGAQAAPQHEAMREQAISPYSCGKSLATHFLQMLASTEALPIQIARLFLVYGPGQKPNRFLPQIIQSCLAKQSFDVSAGEQLRDFLYIDDAVQGLYQCALYKDAFGEVFNIASGRAVQLRDMIHQVQQLVGAGQPNFGARAYRKGENMALFADIDKAKQCLNWQPKVDLAQGLADTIAWYKTQQDKQTQEVA